MQNIRLCLVALAIAVLAGCNPTARRTVVRSVNDAARAACEAAFGEHPEDLPQGVTIEDICKAHEDVYPFVKAIVGAKQEVLDGMASAPPEPEPAACEPCEECEECSCPEQEPEPAPEAEQPEPEDGG